MPSAQLQKLPGCKGVEECAFQTPSRMFSGPGHRTASGQKEEGWKYPTTELDWFVYNTNKNSSGEDDALSCWP